MRAVATALLGRHRARPRARTPAQLAATGRAALAAVLGIGLVYAPTLVTLWRDLNIERTAHPRRAARRDGRAPARLGAADARAHPEPGRRVERGRSPRPRSGARAAQLAVRGRHAGRQRPRHRPARLRRGARAGLPGEHRGRRGGKSTERASGELAAAAREAMLNAARHAGGEVSVYVERPPTEVDVYVRDRGPGFALDDVATDRLGVRQSIIGRMRRAGGSRSWPGAGGIGTEVHLRFRRGGAPWLSRDRRRCRRPLDLPLRPEGRPRRERAGDRRGARRRVRGDRGDGCRARRRAARRAPSRGRRPWARPAVPR